MNTRKGLEAYTNIGILPATPPRRAARNVITVYLNEQERHVVGWINTELGGTVSSNLRTILFEWARERFKFSHNSAMLTAAQVQLNAMERDKVEEGLGG